MKVRLPDHVMLAGVGGEAVVLNTRTEQFHGLNRTAARMLEVLRDTPDVGEAGARLAGEFGVDLGVITRDLDSLVEGLCARGLLERLSDG